MAKLTIILDFIEDISLQRLMVHPKICPTIERGCTHPYFTTYNEKKIELFNHLAFNHNMTEWYKGINKANPSPKRLEPNYEKNCGEWLILDKPKLGALKIEERYNREDVICPVAMMTVTNDGDNAYKVYLPMCECCSRIDTQKEGYEASRDIPHYYKDGYKWEERPFEAIMFKLQQARKICYTYFEYWLYTRSINQKVKLGGFRIL